MDWAKPSKVCFFLICLAAFGTGLPVLAQSAAVRQCLEESPAAPVARTSSLSDRYIDCGIQQMKNKNYKSVIELAEASLKESDSRLADFPSVVYQAKALAYREMGQLEAALANSNLAVEHAPVDPSVYQARASIYERLGNRQASQADLQTAQVLAGSSNPQSFAANGPSDSNNRGAPVGTIATSGTHRCSRLIAGWPLPFDALDLPWNLSQSQFFQEYNYFVPCLKTNERGNPYATLQTSEGPLEAFFYFKNNGKLSGIMLEGKAVSEYEKQMTQRFGPFAHVEHEVLETFSYPGIGIVTQPVVRRSNSRAKQIDKTIIFFQPGEREPMSGIFLQGFEYVR